MQLQKIPGSGVSARRIAQRSRLCMRVVAQAGPVKVEKTGEQALRLCGAQPRSPRRPQHTSANVPARCSQLPGSHLVPPLAQIPGDVHNLIPIQSHPASQPTP